MQWPKHRSWGKGRYIQIGEKKKVLSTHWKQKVGIKYKRRKALERSFGAILQGL